MKIFKLRKGKSRIYSLTAEEYEHATQLKYPFKTVGKDGTTRYFAICPWCDNPIQIIGLYAKNDTPLYGKHYSRDTKIAEYNQSKYFFCPYASHQYSTIEINELRFMNWITAEKAQKYRKSQRNQRLLQIADDMMGTVKNS